MSGQLQRVVTASFAPASGSQPLAIQPDPGFYVDALVHLLLIPDVPATLSATVGEVRLGNSKLVDIAPGGLQFSGGDSAALPAPPAEGPPELKVIFAADSKGQPVSIGAHYAPASFEVRLSQACTAAVSYGPYKASAKMITYHPKVEASPAGGSKTTYGVIFAYYQGTLIQYPVAPPTIEFGNAGTELYRWHSYKVINADGQFEKPPGYPQVGTYPGKSFVLDVVGSREVERIHEIVFINQSGRPDGYTPSVPILEPYVGDNNYTPAITVQIATLDPEKYPKEMIARAQDYLRSKGLRGMNA